MRMSLPALIEEWKKDSKLDKTEPGLEVLKNPSLHAKYQEQLTLHNVSRMEAEMAYNSLRRSRSDYYQGRMSQAELEKHGLTAFPFVLAKDLGLYLEADPALQDAKRKVAVHEEAVTFLMSVIKAIGNRGFDIRSYIDWIKYTQGSVT